MEIKQVQKLAQKLALTPQMKQSLHILQLASVELKDYLEEQIVENPVLERESQSSSEEDIFERLAQQERITEDSYAEYPSGDYAQELDKRKEYRESLITKPVTLGEMLLAQLRMCRLKPLEYAIGEQIIHNIDENGYLMISLDEIAAILNKKDASGKKNVTLKEAEEMLFRIQCFSPRGVGARNLQECLLIQLKACHNKDPLVEAVVTKYLPDVARNKIKVIAKKLKVRPEKVKDAIGMISHLEPKPGRLFSSPAGLRAGRSYPDIVLEKRKKGFDIIVNNTFLPRFRISRRYRAILASSDVPAETKKYVKEKIKAAQNLKKAISQRDNTLKKVAQCLIELQDDFLREGDIGLLKPLTFRQIAARIDRNESTVSRVVNSKYIKTPHGIFRLNRFFSKPLRKSDFNSPSREFIKSKVYSIISEENKKKPLDDAAIALLIQEEGFKVARRTVAKYREELKIPPVYRRRKK